MTTSPHSGRTKVLTIAVVSLITGLAGGWWLGRNTADDAHQKERANRLQTITGPVVPSRETKQNANSPSIFNRSFEGPAATDRKAAADQFRDALRPLSRVQRAKNMLAVLEKMSPENGQAYLDGWLDFVNQGGVPESEKQLFNRRIGEVAGPIVVGRRTGSSWDMGAVGAVREQFMGWMQTDPAAARQWLDGLTNERFREQLMDSYVAVIADSDPKAALTFLKDLPEDLQTRSAGVLVNAASAGRTQAEMGAWMKDLTAEAGDRKDAPWLQAACDAVMQNYASARICGESAVAVYEENLGQPWLSPHWGMRLAHAYARSDTAGGLAWAAKMQPKDSGMVSSAVSGVLPDKLEDALTWAQSPASGDLRQPFLTAIAGRFQETNPARAAEIKNMLENENPPAPGAPENN